MRQQRRILSLLSLVVLASVILSIPLSASALPPASPVFNSKSVTLSTSMSATFMTTTSIDCKSIEVISVTLQRQDGSAWVFEKYLACPTGVATNINSLVTSKKYADDCVKGNTYRLYVTFQADGYCNPTKLYGIRHWINKDPGYRGIWRDRAGCDEMIARGHMRQST